MATFNGTGTFTGRHGSSLPTQLLRRHLHRVVGDSILVAGIPPDDVGSILSTAFAEREVVFLAFHYGAFLRTQTLLSSSQNPRHCALFSSWYEVRSRQHNCAVVYLQKGKELNELVLAMAARSLAPNSRVFLVGENNAGIRSSASLLESTVGPILTSDAARHCVIYQAQRRNASICLPSSPDFWARDFAVHLPGADLHVRSFPGVFSHGRVDPGTQLLLDHLPRNANGDVLDFGCGSGVIGAAIKVGNLDCQITLVDNSAFALAAAAATFKLNNITPAAIVPSDIYSNVGGVFDLVISNPPFHQGVGTDYDVVTIFLTESGRVLRPGGSLIIVANRFLRYEGIIERHIGPVSLLAQDNAYKVLSSRSVVHRRSEKLGRPPKRT